MAEYSGEIHEYILNLPSPKYSGRSSITLIGGEFGRALITFLPEAEPLPDNHKSDPGPLFYIYYPRDYWATIIDILRNEKPAYFRFTTPDCHAQISTRREPVGEEEAV